MGNVPQENEDININESLSYSNQFHRPVSYEDFQLIKKLGTGGYGQVFLARKKRGLFKDEPFAVKVISKAKLLNKGKDKIYAQIEKDVLSLINKHPCPFLVSLYYAFDNEDYIFFCLEYLSGGELFMNLERKEILTESECRFYTAEVVIALAHLHKLGIVYRDVKSENVMIDKHGHVKLTDFGLSKFLDETKKTKTFCGTIEYMAPEVISKKEYSFEVDWWGMGILIYDMLIGGSPFSSSKRENVIQKVLNGKYSLPSSLSHSAKSIIKRFLVASIPDRLGSKSVDDIKKHSFFKGLDWKKLCNREISPPFIPKMENNFDVTFFDPKIVEEPLELIEVQYINRDPDAFIDFSYVAPFALEVELSETWMICDESSNESDDDDDCTMEIEIEFS